MYKVTKLVVEKALAVYACQCNIKHMYTYIIMNYPILAYSTGPNLVVLLVLEPIMFQVKKKGFQEAFQCSETT